jgi:exopolyphosphatase/guanosine-5'-triphosphate,3'-diphosphate pyrophosphatase
MAIGGSGTIENLADIVFRQLHGRPRTRDDTVTLDEVRTVARTLRKLPLDERRRVPGINPDRADIIVPGAAILESLMEALGIDELHISDRGLREGLIVDHVARHDPLHLTRMTVRERSVMQLGHACRFDADHARNVATLALALFDSAAEEGLHDLGPAERELLYYASLLHDIGTFLSHSQHERHAHYMIQNADLLGFNQSEVAAIAAVARFHRKGFPSAKRPEVRDLDRGYQRSLPALSVLLRLAESLDRSHAGLVDAARLQDQGDGHVALLVHAPTEPLLEIWGARQQRAAFRQAFGRQLLIRSTAGGA